MFLEPRHQSFLIAPSFKLHLIHISKVFVLCVLLASLLGSLAHARKAPQARNSANYKVRAEMPSLLDLDRPLEEQGLRASAHADTFILAQWTFDAGAGLCTDEGWTSHDLTEQTGCYFHIDDFDGLGGGSFGRLTPLEGNQSLWCGARPDTASPILCRYAVLPGYGNEWSQSWCFKCIDVPDTEEVFISYLIAWDSEPSFDYTYLEYATKSTCDSLSSIDVIAPGDWVKIATFDDIGAKQVRPDVIPVGHRGAIKIRFQFQSDGAWSDEDGLLDTDGAVIIDSITVEAAFTIHDFEDFEDESPGDIATTDGDWTCAVGLPYGDFAGLFHGSTLLQEDPCVRNLSCMWAFIKGSTKTYACGGHPEQVAVPYGNERDQYLFNEIWSPQIDHDPPGSSGSVYELCYWTYWDHPLPQMVFSVWHIRNWIAGCPDEWDEESFINYGGGGIWGQSVHPVAHFIDPAADAVQLALGCWDYCGYYCSPSWPGDCHSHAPLFDNVVLRRISTMGPQWNVWPLDLFQDNFAADGTDTGTVRIDIADDVLPRQSSNLRPGDSLAVAVFEPTVGLLEPDPLSGFGSAVYFYLSRDPQSKPMPLDKTVEDSFRWPLVDSVICDGRKWYQFRMDTCFTERSGPRTGALSGCFCIDINDHYFTGGDTLWYFFGATDANAITSFWSRITGVTDSEGEVRASPMEVTCLPANALNGVTDILYVDNFDGLGAQPYFETAFENLGLRPDRYDMYRSPYRSGEFLEVDSGPASRVANVQQQLISHYRKIIWNSGNLILGQIGDGTGNPTKVDDFSLLFTFLDSSATGAGIYFSGDNLAQEWVNLYGANAINFRNTFMNFNLFSSNHVTVGEPVSPLVIAQLSSCFDHPTGLDSLIAYGGCPIINDFDVITPTGAAQLEMTYSDNAAHGAVISQITPNAAGDTARVMLSGFSYHEIRDDRAQAPVDRVTHLATVLRWLDNQVDDPTAVQTTPQFENRLAQNYPNPFNPSTTIKYSIKERAHVSLKIYNVAGQLVKTLVDEEKAPGEYATGWNGRSDAGNPVSSGVYFYRLVTKNFTQTKKLVILK